MPASTRRAGIAATRATESPRAEAAGARGTATSMATSWSSAGRARPLNGGLLGVGGRRGALGRDEEAAVRALEPLVARGLARQQAPLEGLLAVRADDLGCPRVHG